MSIVKHVEMLLNMVNARRIVRVHVYFCHLLVILAFVGLPEKVVFNLIHVKHRIMFVEKQIISVFIILDVIHILFVILRQ
jgi:hypothetical protein